MQGDGDVSVSKNMTLCWDCKKAVGGCSWSNQLCPVEDWTAIPTKIGTPFESYVVLDCPEFIRDSWAGGAKRGRPTL